jgi:basic amino acid/polyamine antiporter, APA family
VATPAQGEISPGAGVSEGPLNRAITRNLLLLLVVGDVLGAGIYALVGKVGGRVGGAIWTAFALSLALARCSPPSPTPSS